MGRKRRPPRRPAGGVPPALNPYGYAWGRRADAANVDPNRNFLLPGEEYRGSPDGYRHFNPLLNPERPPGRWDPFVLHAWVALARHGLPALKQALVGGQYDYPKGVFFGGHGPSATHLALKERFREWVGPAAKWCTSTSTPGSAGGGRTSCFSTRR